MTRQATILVVDDRPANVKLLVDLLEFHGYGVTTATSGEEALGYLAVHCPHLVLLDVMLPGISGYEVCQKIRENPHTALLPVVMVTALDPEQERIRGLDSGADDFLSRPINQAELLARVRSLIRVKDLHDKVRSQAAQLAEWSKTLERRVEDQLAQLERLGRLKSFFSPQVAELIIGNRSEEPLRSHRREVTVVFVDLRGFTAFAEMAEPEDVTEVLREFHSEMGRLIFTYEGTLERFTGDGMMIFFNDPIETSDHAERAVRMALDMRGALRNLRGKWLLRGFHLDFSAGIATGDATIGTIGFDGRRDYAVIGSVTNLAARLCAAALPGQIMVSHRFLSGVKETIETEAIGEFLLKGFQRPITVHNLVSLKSRVSRAPESGVGLPTLRQERLPSLTATAITADA